jgi:hypothetical protein
VQVDPVKPMLKGPGAKRLTLKYHELLSSFAFSFNLSRYNEECQVADYPDHKLKCKQIIAAKRKQAAGGGNVQNLHDI